MQATSSRARDAAFRRASGQANGARERGKWLMVSLAGRHKEVERLLLAGHHKGWRAPAATQPGTATTRKEKGRKRITTAGTTITWRNCDSGSGK